jgi:acetyl-CoA carboxylase carboxyl transferase subunit alpha
MAQRVKMYLSRTLRELLTIPLDDLLRVRYDKFRRMGVFMESV